MIKWIIIASVAVLLILALIVFVSLRKRKKTNIKLDETIKKLKQENEEVTQRQQIEDDKKKEEEAFANITLADDIEDEFPDINFASQKFQVDEPNFIAQEKEEVNINFDDLNKEKSQTQNDQKKTSDQRYEEFMNEHAFSRRGVDKKLLEQLQSLPPKVKAIVLGNVFNKLED